MTHEYVTGMSLSLAMLKNSVATEAYLWNWSTISKCPLSITLQWKSCI